MIVHALRHHTSKRYLVVLSGDTSTAKYTAYFETPNEVEATTWLTRELAEQAHMALGSFAGAWRIVHLERTLSDADADKMLAALREEGL